VYDPACVTRYTTAPAISSGLAILPMGIPGRMSFSMICSFFVMTEENFVSVMPGSTALTRMLKGASSLAQDLVMEMTPALVSEYMPCMIAGLTPLTDDMFTIDPPPDFSISLAACCVMKKYPFRFTRQCLFPCRIRGVYVVPEKRVRGGIVYQDMELPVLVFHLAEERSYLVHVPGVARHGHGLAAGGGYFLLHFLEPFELAAHQYHLGPQGGKRLGYLFADPAARAGDQCYLTAQIVLLCIRIVSSHDILLMIVELPVLQPSQVF
jgi:hypothetical protein